MRRRSEPKSLESRLANVLMVELVGRGPVAPTNDFAQTLEFRREDVDTNRVVRIAPIEDETVPYSPVELDAIVGQPTEPSEPYALIEIKATTPASSLAAPLTPRAFTASQNLVAVDEPIIHHEPTLARQPTSAVSLIVFALLFAALGLGIAISFMVASIAG